MAVALFMRNSRPKPKQTLAPPNAGNKLINNHWFRSSQAVSTTAFCVSSRDGSARSTFSKYLQWHVHRWTRRPVVPELPGRFSGMLGQMIGLLVSFPIVSSCIGSS